ncbi:MAG: xanthine dehydrogenase family protein subunit M [Acidobacteria bacterium]|nr:xanthine dehydrogenase family protein subunit M [Acidobacteriota bacterium]
MYTAAFEYHRASSLEEAATMLSQIGEGAKILAGGQSLIPLMKLRLAAPSHLIDIGFTSGGSYIREEGRLLRLGALTSHAEIELSPVAQRIAIVHDCAAGIADVQVRNRGTIGGSLAEADPSGDWATALLALSAEVHLISPAGERTLALDDFIKDAYTTALRSNEVIAEIRVHVPDAGSGGAYICLKRAAPVYATASVAVELKLEGNVCRQAAIVLGCVGLTPIRVDGAEAALRGREIDDVALEAAGEAVRVAADPESDMRGSAEYKRTVAGALVKRALRAALGRARGEIVETSHLYA